MKTNNPQNPARELSFNVMTFNALCMNALQRAHLNPAKRTFRVINYRKLALRLAMVVLIVFSAVFVYKYATVDALSVYNKQFTSYELGITRGGSKPDLQNFTYLNENWLDVVAINNLAPVKTNKSRFLAGMAQMELKKYASALELFQEVLSNSKDESFRDDAEYYAALGYLAIHETAPALELIHQIKANPDHKYYFLVRNISPLDLKIIGIKK